MKKTQQTLTTIIVFIILTFFAGPTWARVCTGDYIIDNINTSGDIAALSGCTEITGSLYIRETQLTSLSGLENLTSTVGKVSIFSNDSLTDLSALQNLTSVGWDLSIQENDSLTSLTGPENLTSLDWDLIIIENTSLTSLSGLQNLTSVDGYFIIQENANLNSLSDLSSLTSVGGAFHIVYCNSLLSLNGLENLTSIDGYLIIQMNEILTNLCALSNVNMRDDRILQIYNNTALSMATANALETQLRDNGFTGVAEIYNNDGSGLGTCDEVNISLGDIIGTVSGDVLENTYMLLYKNSCGASELLEYVFADTDGNYSFTDLSNGNYKVTPMLSGYTFSPSDQILTFSGAPVTGVDFIILN